MRNLIDGLRIGVARVMANAECEVAERESLVVADKAKTILNLPLGAGK